MRTTAGGRPAAPRWAWLNVLLAIAVTFAILLAFGVVPLIDGLNVVLRKVGLSRPSSEGRTPGQVHTGRVTREFAWDPAAGAVVGTVLVKGELWTAVCDPDLASDFREGMAVRIEYSDDLQVRVLGRAE